MREFADDPVENRWRFENRNVGSKADSRQECPPHTEGAPLNQSTWKAIAGDIHFWVPVIVLILGTALLAVLR